MFFDVGFQGALKDLSLRIGKQQVVWGEADLFRSLDIVNPLDIRQNGFVGEDFSDFRQPLDIFKALYNFGSVASFWNEAGIEAFWSPNSRPQANQRTSCSATPGSSTQRRAAQSAFATRIRRRLQPQLRGALRADAAPMGNSAGRHPQRRFAGRTSSRATGVLRTSCTASRTTCRRTEFSWDAMMAGVRLLGTTYGNAYFTLNYLYKRTDAASASVPLAQLLDPAQPNFGALNLAVFRRERSQQAATPDLNGNGIPDGQEEQIHNCLQSRYPTGGHWPSGTLPPGLVRSSSTPGPSAPVGRVDWHGSVWSDPANPELASGVQAGTNGVPAGANQLNTQHMAYNPPLRLPRHAGHPGRRAAPPETGFRTRRSASTSPCSTRGRTSSAAR